MFELATENVNPGMESREADVQRTSKSSLYSRIHGVRYGVVIIIRLPSFVIPVKKICTQKKNHVCNKCDKL